MNEKFNEFEQEPNLRPTLLTVLCILTFIGSGWTILSSGYSYSTASVTAEMFSSATKKQSNDSTFREDSIKRNGNKNKSFFKLKMMGSLSKMMTEENLRKSAIGAIVSGLFTLLGAFLMWRLKRVGFYLYIAGIVIGLIVPFYLYGNNLLAVGVSSVTTFFGLLFIALYALNMKNLR